MNEDDLIWIVWWVWIAVALYWLFRRISRKSREKKKSLRQAEAKAARELRADKRPTYAEALESEVAATRAVMYPDENWTLTVNAIVASKTLEDDLGRFADGPPARYELEQDRRDTLLAHARRDAAEALLNSRTLLNEVNAFKAALNNLSRSLFWLWVALMLWTWWRSGFALWDWVKWWNWLK